MKSKERLELLIKELNTSSYKLARDLEYGNPTVIYHVINGRNGISHKLAENIVNKYPKVNIKWLLDGDGEMFINENDIEGNIDVFKRLDILEKKIDLILSKLGKQ